MQQMYGPPRVLKRHLDWLYICGGNYPTGQCAPKNQGMVRHEPQQALWCIFHKHWENHSTKNCFIRIQHMREQA